MWLELLFTTKYSQPVSLNFRMIDVECHSCLLSPAYDKTPWPKQVGEESIYFTSQFISPFMGQCSKGTQGRNLETAEEAETTEEHCFLDWLPWLAWPVFLYSPALRAQVWHHPQQPVCSKWAKPIKRDVFFFSFLSFSSIVLLVLQCSFLFIYSTDIIECCQHAQCCLRLRGFISKTD